MDDLFLKGLLLGISVAAPVGPIGILCIRRTLSEGRLSGFVSGLGAATADTLYGLVAAFGMAWVANALLGIPWLRLLGIGFLLFLGGKIFLSQPTDQAAGATGGNLLRSYSSTFFLTVTNPATILSFAAMFTGLGLSGGYLSAAWMVLGVFLGSAAWWLFLAGVTGWLRGSLTMNGMRWINRISGTLIVGLGLIALVPLVLR